MITDEQFQMNAIIKQATTYADLQRLRTNNTNLDSQSLKLGEKSKKRKPQHKLEFHYVIARKLNLNL